MESTLHPTQAILDASQGVGALHQLALELLGLQLRPLRDERRDDDAGQWQTVGSYLVNELTSDATQPAGSNAWNILTQALADRLVVRLGHRAVVERPVENRLVHPRLTRDLSKRPGG